MPLYVADYLRDTRKLTAAEHGAYLLLIMEYWTAGKLPDDDKQLSRIACMTGAEWRKAKPNVKDFFTGTWTHKRIDAELARSAEISSKRAASAKQKHSKSSAIAEQMDTHAGGLPQPQLQKEDRIGDARGQSSFTEGSKKLAEAFLKALGIQGPLQIPPELAGVDWRAIEWERAGYDEDLIRSETSRFAGDEPKKPISYFEKVFATAFAKRNAPLVKAEIVHPENIKVTAHGKQSGNILQASQRLIDTLRSFDAGPDDPKQLRSGAGAADVRLLSQG